MSAVKPIIDDKEIIDNFCCAILLSAIADYKMNCRKYRIIKPKWEEYVLEYDLAMTKFHRKVALLGPMPEGITNRKDDPRYVKLYNQYLKETSRYRRALRVITAVEDSVRFFETSPLGSALCWEFDIDPDEIIDMLNSRGFRHEFVRYTHGS